MSSIVRLPRSGRCGGVLLVALACFSFAINVPSAFARSAGRDEYDYRLMRLKEDHVRAGKIYYNIKMYEKAVEQFEQALEIDPQDKGVEGLLKSAKKQLEIGAHPAAIKEEKKIEEKAEAKRIEEEKKLPEEPAPKEASGVKKAPEPVAEEKVAEEKVLEEKAVEEKVKAPPQAEQERKEAKTEERARTPLAGQMMPGEPIVVNGDKVEYFHEKKQVVGSGNVSITYKDVVMTCDKITVYLDTREAIAEGGVKITQKDAFFTGEKINYNFDTKVGRVINGYVSYKPFYGKAQDLSKVSEKQVNLERGYVTTCELEKPHYRVQARQVRIYLDDKVVAKHILFFIGNVPVMYFPYYVQPLKERSAHATLQVGKDKDWGYYALTSYRYYFSEMCNGRFLIDYRTKKGLAEGIDNYYSIKGLGNGSVKFYYTHENDVTAFEKTGEVESKYRVQVRHKWQVDDYTLATFEFNKLRDQNFIKDYFYNEYEEEGTPDNYLSLITTKNNYTISFLMRKRMDKYFTIVERLPELAIDIPNSRLFKNIPIYYKQSTSGVYLNQTFQATVPEQKDLNTIRFDTYHRVSYAATLPGALNLTPYAGVEETFYSRNKWGETNQIRSVFTAGLDASVKFYRIYNVESSFLGLDTHKLRHIITPTANYYYTHQPTVSPDNLNQFDYIDAADAQNGVKLSLENKLQTKRPQSDQDPTLKSVDLANLIISSDYAFRLKKDNVSYKSQKFKTVDFQLELTPYPWFYSLVTMIVDTKSSSIQSESIDLVARQGEKWSLGLGQRYENVESGESNLMTVDATYKINNKWKVRAYERFNAKNGAFEEQEYTVYRDLHCWLAEFTYNIKPYMSDQTFWVVFRLKAFPDYPIGFKRTYYRPRFGSAGAE